MDKEKITVIVLVILVLLAVLYAAGIINFNFGKKSENSASSGGGSGDIPQECQKPADQDIQAWKEHLEHHENTKYCLDYFK